MSEINKMELREKVISLYFKVNNLDQIIKELLKKGIEINHDSICGIMCSYTQNLRSISLDDIDPKMSDKQKEFIKTVIEDEKARHLYKQKISEATALKQEHIKNMNVLQRPFRQSVQELDTINAGLINASLLDLYVNGVTPESLGEFIRDLEEYSIEKHIKVKTAFDNIVIHSEKDLEAVRRSLPERRAKKWLKDKDKDIGQD